MTYKRIFKFTKDNRIKSKGEFQLVYNTGRSIVDGLSVLYVLRSENAKIKIGLAVGKKIGNAVVRNRIKRLMRETFRKYKDQLKENTQIVWVARKKLQSADLKTYERVFLRLAKRAALLKEG